MTGEAEEEKWFETESWRDILHNEKEWSLEFSDDGEQGFQVKKGEYSKKGWMILVKQTDIIKINVKRSKGKPV